MTLQFGNNVDDFQNQGIWQGLSQIGGGGGAANGAMDWNTQMQTLLANGDIAGASSIQSMLDTKGFNADSLAAMSKMNQPPSKWATGAQTFGNIAQGIGSMANVYMGLKNMKLQKEAFQFNKGITNTNMNNSILDYNRRLGETLSNRALNNGQGDGWVSSQLEKYSAKRS